MPRPRADASVFHAIADPTRRGVLDELRQGERSVSHLTRALGVSQPAMSQHLRVLLDAGLVDQRPDGRQRLYRLSPEPLRSVHHWLAHYEQFWTQKLSALRAFLDAHDPPAAAPSAPPRKAAPRRAAPIRRTPSKGTQP